jgi:hypothetical protein
VDGRPPRGATVARSALFGDNIEAVISFGGLAHRAWQSYAKRVGGRAQAVPYAHVRHPTWPESSSGANAEALAKATKELLSDWNRALKRLAPEIRHPDVPTALIPYGTSWQPEDLAPIPPEDVPAGLPPWMRSLTPWAQRVGATAAQKRATLAITVPSDALPQPGPSPARAERAAVAPSPPSTLELDAAQVLAAAVHATRGPGPVRAEVSRRLALRGRVVTMNARDEVIDDGIVWLENQTIAAVQPADAPPPPAFAGIEPVDTRGTIYPGFMDLHNHLAYNILSLCPTLTALGIEKRAISPWDQQVRVRSAC